MSLGSPGDHLSQVPKFTTCSNSFPSILIFTVLSLPLLILMIFVFLTFIFMSYSSDIVFSLSIILCKPFWMAAIIAWSSANLSAFVSCPPTFMPSGISSMIHCFSHHFFDVDVEEYWRKRASLPYTPLPITPGSEHSPSILILTFWPMYKFPMSLLSFVQHHTN